MDNAIFAVLLAGNFLSVNSWTDGAAMGSYLVDGKKKNKETNMEHQKRDEKWNRTPPKAGEKHTKKHNKTIFH